MIIDSSSAARGLRSVLTHPLALAIKRPARDLLWLVKARRVRNPPMPAQVASMLFVCLGNICRSPFAERLAAARRPGIRCLSAGIKTTQSARSPTEACEAAATRGIWLDGHRPMTLTRQMVDEYDLVIVMEAGQLEQLRGLYPAAVPRLFLLPLFQSGAPRGYERYNIADPFSRPRSEYDECYDRIDRAVAGLLTALSSGVPVA